MSQNGKGDSRRPRSVNYKTWENNWEKIFRKQPNKTKKNVKRNDKF